MDYHIKAKGLEKKYNIMKQFLLMKKNTNLKFVDLGYEISSCGNTVWPKTGHILFWLSVFYYKTDLNYVKVLNIKWLQPKILRISGKKTFSPF